MRTKGLTISGGAARLVSALLLGAALPLVSGTSRAADEPAVEAPYVRCGGDDGDPLQRALDDRKIKYRAWARYANTHRWDNQPPERAAAAVVGYLGPSTKLKLPWSDAQAVKEFLSSLYEARMLENDQDMGLNSWMRVLYLNSANSSLPSAASDTILQTLREFRFWVEEPRTGNDQSKQVFWSENHQAMYATVELLAGQWMPNDRFRDGALGSVHRARAEARLERWLDDRLRFGFSEWNSPVYYEYEILPMLNLADFAENPRIAQRAAMVLDILLFDLARFTQRGSFGVTAGRAYAEHKVGGAQSVGDVVEMLFGTRGYWQDPNSPAANALAATRRYCVPSALLAIGQHRPERFVDRTRVSVNFGDPGAPGVSSDADGLAWWSRSAYFVGNMRTKTNEMIAKWRLPEGLGDDHAWIANVPVPGGQANDLLSVFFEGLALTRANLYTYRDSGAMLSSVQQFRVGQMSPQMSPWMVTIDNDVSVFGTYPAALSAHDGPNWWTGNAVNPFVVQKESAAIVVYGPNPLGAQALAFGHRTHLWFPMQSREYRDDPVAGQFWQTGKGKFDAVRLERIQWSNDLDDSVWIFGMKRTPDGEAYVGIYSAQPCEAVTTGTWAGKEVVCEGLRNAFVIQVGSQKTFGSFDRFVDLCRHARIFVGAGIRNPLNPLVDMVVNFDSPDPIMAATPGGHRLQIDYGAREVRYGNQLFDVNNFPRFENPYTNTPWGAQQYTIAHAGLKLYHDVARSIRDGHGLKALPYEGVFDYTFWSKEYLYGIRPDGTLVWFGHMRGDNRNPPTTGGPFVGGASDRLKAGTEVVGRAGGKVRPGVAETLDSGARGAVFRNSPAAAASTTVGGASTSVSGRAAAASTVTTASNPPPQPGPGTIKPGLTAPSLASDPRLQLGAIQDPNPRLIHAWEGPKPIGTGWQIFRDVIPGGVFNLTPSVAAASFYGVTPDGVLKWYRHDGFVYGEPRWQGPIDVATGWNAFTKIIAMGDGVLYGIGTDGSLRWYRHTDAGATANPPHWTAPQIVGQGWGQFTRVFSTGEGYLYAVDAQGMLWWYHHVGYFDGSNVWDPPKRIGSSWNQFREVFSPGGGLIYAITQGGDMLWYEHLGYKDGSMRWRGPTYIGPANWKDYAHVFPVMWGKPTSPILH